MNFTRLLNPTETKKFYRLRHDLVRLDGDRELSVDQQPLQRHFFVRSHGWPEVAVATLDVGAANDEDDVDAAPFGVKLKEQ